MVRFYKKKEGGCVMAGFNLFKGVPEVAVEQLIDKVGNSHKMDDGKVFDRPMSEYDDPLGFYEESDGPPDKVGSPLDRMSEGEVFDRPMSEYDDPLGFYEKPDGPPDKVGSPPDRMSEGEVFDRPMSEYDDPLGFYEKSDGPTEVGNLPDRMSEGDADIPMPGTPSPPREADVRIIMPGKPFPDLPKPDVGKRKEGDPPYLPESDPADVPMPRTPSPPREADVLRYHDRGESFGDLPEVAEGDADALDDLPDVATIDDSDDVSESDDENEKEAAIKKQEEAIEQAKENGVEDLSAIEKGNFGEMCTDKDMREKGYERISKDIVTDVSESGHKGIDGVYENPNGNPRYIIADSKYGTAQLQETQDGKQLSETWIDGRLDDAVGKEKADEIRSEQADNVGVAVAHVDENGNVTYESIDSNGNGIEGKEVFHND
jgi:hypothetical protein